MIKPVTLLAISILPLAGCASVPAAEAEAQTVPATYMALGTEPFWNLEITPTQLNLNRLDAPRLAVPNPGWEDVIGVRTIHTPDITVNVVRESCTDGMSAQMYPDRVEVMIGNQVLNGCGGVATPLPLASLERSSWRIVTVNGRPAVPGVEADLQFADGRVTGSAGCNRLSGPYTQERNRLNFGNIASTRMACPGPRGDQEDWVFAMMRGPVTISFGERMTMTWNNAAGSAIVFRRLDWD